MKNIIITGGCGLIGKSLVKYISKTDNVLIADTNYKEAKKIIKLTKSKNIKFFNCNITKDISVDKLLKKTEDKFGYIDSLIHCAYPKSSQFGKNFGKLNRRGINIDLDNHITSTIMLSQKILKLFLKQKHGNLILFSSIQGIAPPKFEHYYGTNMVSPIEYSAIKSAIISITKYLAKLYKKKNIRVNCISPGGIIYKQPKKFVQNYLKSTGNKGLLNPEDLNVAVKFLLSENSKCYNGQNLIVDDGWSL